MSAFFDLPHTVLDDEIDAQNHVHNLRYIQWSLWAAGKHTAALGLDTAAELKRGFGFVVRKHDAEYRRAALDGDELIVRTWIYQIDRFSSWRQTYICRQSDRSVLARIKTRWVYADLKQHRVAEIPPQLVAAVHLQPTVPSMPWD